MKLPAHLVIALGLLLPSSLPSQQPTSATLTLDQALAIARERNPDYRQALNRVYRDGCDMMPVYSRGSDTSEASRRRRNGSLFTLQAPCA